MSEIDARKLKVLLSVLQRAPVSEAEQIVCAEVVAQLVALAAGEPLDKETGRQGDEEMG